MYTSIYFKKMLACWYILINHNGVQYFKTITQANFVDYKCLNLILPQPLQLQLDTLGIFY